MFSQIKVYTQLIVKYFNTEVYSVQSVTLDGGRYTVPVPTWEFVHENPFSNTITYKYYQVDNYDYKLFNFINSQTNFEEEYSKNQFFETILVFKNENEKDKFNAFIKSNFRKIYDEIKREKDNIKVFEVDNENEEQIIQERLATAKVLKELQLEILKEDN